MRRKFDNLCWNVIICDDFGTIYNVLRENSRVIVYIKECLKKKKPIEGGRIQRILSSHYWSRSEYEVLVTDLLGKNERKIDVYMQLWLNFEPLLQYLEKNLDIEISRVGIDNDNWMWGL